MAQRKDWSLFKLTIEQYKCFRTCVCSVRVMCLAVGTPGTSVSGGCDISALVPLVERAFINVVSEVLSLPYIYAKIS